MTPTADRAALLFLAGEAFTGLTPGDGHVIARYFSGIADIIREHGGEPDATIASYGIDPGEFARPHGRIPCLGALRMIEELAEWFDDPVLGLRLAAAQTADAYGYIAPLCQAARDVRQAIETFVSYVPAAVTPEGMFSLIESGARIEIRWDCDSELRQHRQGSLHGAGMLLKLLRSIIADDFQPDQVMLPAFGQSGPPPGLDRWLNCPVRFTRHNHGSIFVAAHHLARPAAHANSFVFDALERPLHALRLQIEQDISTRVTGFIRAHLHRPDLTVEACAAQLGTSVRTLQKHLARMDTSFSAMLEAEKCDRARVALQCSPLSLDQLAFQLGYAEQSTFGRAFRRWTGMSPGEYRRSATLPYRSAGSTLSAKVRA